MDRLADLVADLLTLGSKLGTVIAALDDPESKLNGSDAAAIVRERRMLGEEIAGVDAGFDLAAQLRADYDDLDDALGLSGGSSSATVARERRMISAQLERIEAPKEVALVDQLAERRQSGAGSARPAARRRKSG